MMKFKNLVQPATRQQLIVGDAQTLDYFGQNERQGRVLIYDYVDLANWTGSSAKASSVRVSRLAALELLRRAPPLRQGFSVELTAAGWALWQPPIPPRKRIDFEDLDLTPLNHIPGARFVNLAFVKRYGRRHGAKACRLVIEAFVKFYNNNRLDPNFTLTWAADAKTGSVWSTSAGMEPSRNTTRLQGPIGFLAYCLSQDHRPNFWFCDEAKPKQSAI